MNGSHYKVFSLLIGLFLLSILTGCSSAEFVFLGIIKKTYSGKAAATAGKGVVNNNTTTAVGHYKGTSLDSASITGLVVAPDSLLLPYAQVSFQPSGSSINEPWITFETDERGRFFIENVVAEDYDIACLYPQYQLKLVSGVRARRIGSKPEVEAIFLSAPTLK
ncbi:MAG: carboxypeptidase regulatory-like domain-containing protein [Saprospiraceae bacterium]|nr:carboxypeptidase regulatory-like domain-containing protein [Saprospiraceae bacterium]